MGYLEEVQKINQTARELLEHGMANSLDEAVTKAREMLKVDSAQAGIERVDERGSATQLHPEITTETAKPVIQDKKPEMSWQEAMKINNDYLIKQFKEMSDKLKNFEEYMGKMVGEMDQVKARITMMQRMAAQSENIQQQPQQQVQQQPQQQPQQQSSSGHYRTGNYNAQDVSIEKMFYFGNKK